MLILDTARFKYPPHWVPLEMLYRWGRLAGGHAWQPLRLRAGAVLALLARWRRMAAALALEAPHTCRAAQAQRWRAALAFLTPL